MKKIIAVFKFGTTTKKVVYTTNILSLLKTDPCIDHIIDYNTGKIIYFKI